MAQVQITAAQVQALEKKNRELENKVKSIEKDMNASYDAEFAKYKNLMRKQIQESSEEREREYEHKLRELKYSMQCRFEAREQELLEQYDELRREIDRSRKEFVKEQEKLKRQLDEIKEADLKKDELKIINAEESLRAAKVSMNELNELPCDLFFPGKATLHKNSIRDISNLIANKMYQAAMAAAVSAKSAMKLFALDVSGQKDLWIQQYKIFEQNVNSLVQAQDKWINRWIEEEEEFKTKDCAVIDLMFWTDERYKECLDKITTWQSEIEHINEVGVDKYLLEKDAISIDVISQYNDEIQRLMESQSLMLDLATNRFNAAVDREDIAEDIRKYMVEEKGYTLDINSSGFKELSVTQRAKQYVKDYMHQWDVSEYDYREQYRLVLFRTDGIEIEIGIIPTQTQDTSVVKNVIVYHVYRNGVPTVEEFRFRDIGAAIAAATNGEIENISTTNDRATMDNLLRNDNLALKQWSMSVKERIQMSR